MHIPIVILLSSRLLSLVLVDFIMMEKVYWLIRMKSDTNCRKSLRIARDFVMMIFSRRGALINSFLLNLCKCRLSTAKSDIWKKLKKTSKWAVEQWKWDLILACSPHIEYQWIGKVNSWIKSIKWAYFPQFRFTRMACLKCARAHQNDENEIEIVNLGLLKKTTNQLNPSAFFSFIWNCEPFKSILLLYCT